MKRFAALFNELDASTSTLAKVDALKRYFAIAEPADAAWAAYFLAGGKPRQVVPTGALRALACQRAGIDDWLFDECYQAVGDLAETIAHVLPPATDTSNAGLAEWIEQRLLPLRELPPDAQMARIGAYWDELDAAGRFLLTKLIGGGFRVGVSRLLVQRALAEHAGIDARVVAQRMMGFTDKATAPDAASYARLLSTDAAPERDAGQPYPFFLAHSVETALGGAAAAATTRGLAAAIAAAGSEAPSAAPTPPAAAAGTPAAAGSALLDRFDSQLGDPADWLVEWKYDGIRAQIVRRAGGTWVWSRGEDLVTDRFPEIVALVEALPDGTVLDGEIVVWKNDAPASFNLLQQRIGRKTLTKKVLADAPAGFIAYDILEWQGDDLREQPQRQRRAQLEAVAAAAGIRVSPAVALPHGESGWRALASVREASRERGVEGFMLKHQASRYGVGRRKQAAGSDGGGTGGWGWLKWKIDPLSVDAVLIYAQAGHGRRASVYTDYTFAVWNRTPADAAEAQAVVDAIAARQPAEPGALQLVPFAKAYSGLTDVEFTRIDRVIRATTLEKFGPVRSVRPTLVFELGFEGINRSPRHKSGIAVRFPRMLRIRDDKPLHEADTLAALEALLGGTAAAATGADPSSNASLTAPTEESS